MTISPMISPLRLLFKLSRLSFNCKKVVRAQGTAVIFGRLQLYYVLKHIEKKLLENLLCERNTSHDRTRASRRRAGEREEEARRLERGGREALSNTRRLEELCRKQNLHHVKSTKTT